MIEINTYQDPNALGAGLNRGKIGRFLKKNARLRNISLKNAIKVGKFVVPIASSIIPGGAIAGKGLSLLSKSGKIGRFATKIARSKVVKGAVKLSKNKTVKGYTGAIGIRNFLPRTTTNYGSEQANFDTPLIQQGGQALPANLIPPATMPAIMQNPYTSSSATMPSEQMLAVKEVAPPMEAEQSTNENPLSAQPKNNTMLYVGGGIALLGIIYLATKKK
jgi:hypothetical protein